MKKIFLVSMLLQLSLLTLSQSVGIGTETPHSSATLHVHTGESDIQGVLVDGELMDVGSQFPSLGGGSRLMFYPARGALRAGYVHGKQWDDLNVGLNSVALGYNTTASDNASTAIGYNNTAAQLASFASGYSTLADANASATFGYYTVANNHSSTVVGCYNEIGPASGTIQQTSPLFVVGNGSENLRSNAMVVRKNGNVEVKRLKVGNGTTFAKQQAGTFAVGASNGAFKKITMDFPASFSTVPKIVAVARNAIGSDYNDTFVVTVRNATANSVTFNIVRVDLPNGWAQNLTIEWMAWE